MFRMARWSPTLAAVMVIVAALTGCEDSEVVAPDGATISLSANPAQIVLVNGTQTTPVDLIATVRSSIGVPLPGQDVRFTTTAGTLTPSVGTPVSTDQFGNATCVLSGALQGPQITATSGKATASQTLSTTTCNLATLAISPSPIVINNCTTPITITATARDSQGKVCTGELVNFAPVATSTPTTDIGMSFSPGSGVTDAMGVATTMLNLQNDCQTKCGTGNSCTGSVQASNSGGTVRSTPPTLINDQVP